MSWVPLGPFTEHTVDIDVQGSTATDAGASFRSLSPTAVVVTEPWVFANHVYPLGGTYINVFAQLVGRYLLAWTVAYTNDSPGARLHLELASTIVEVEAEADGLPHTVTLSGVFDVPTVASSEGEGSVISTGFFLGPSGGTMTAEPSTLTVEYSSSWLPIGPEMLPAPNWIPLGPGFAVEPPPDPTRINYVGQIGAGSLTGDSVTSFDVPIPETADVGDIILVAVSGYRCYVTSPDGEPAGWTRTNFELDEVDSGFFYYWCTSDLLYYEVADVSERGTTATFDCTMYADSALRWSAYRFDGADQQGGAPGTWGLSSTAQGAHDTTFASSFDSQPTEPFRFPDWTATAPGYAITLWTWAMQWVVTEEGSGPDVWAGAITSVPDMTILDQGAVGDVNYVLGIELMNDFHDAAPVRILTLDRAVGAEAQWTLVIGDASPKD